MALAESTSQPRAETEAQQTSPNQQQSPIPWIAPSPFGPSPIIVVPLIVPERERSKQEQHKPSEYRPNCQSPNDHDEADLCEQRRMAKAAEEATAVARDQYWLAWWTFGALVLTVVFTGAAAIAAGLTIRTMQDIAQRQLQAYLYIEQIAVQLSRDGEWFVFDTDVILKNGGVTPANLSEITIYTHLFGGTPGGRRNDSPSEIGPDATYGWSSRGSFKATDFRGEPGGVLYGTWIVVVDYSYAASRELKLNKVVEYKGLVKIWPQQTFPLEIKMIRFVQPKPSQSEA